MAVGKNARPLYRAFWILFLAVFCLYAASAAAATARIALVQGTASTPNDAERNYARRVTERISGWMQELGIPYDLLDDESAVSLAGAENTAVAVLTYNPTLPEKEIEALRQFTRRGGKLIVFYSCDEALASLMKVKMGRYMKATKRRQWHSFSFNSSAPSGLPAKVFQNSYNIRPVYPADKNTTVIAWWQDSEGKRLSDPAWVQSERGFWMTHVLLDGSIQEKKEMLVGLIGAYEPSVWRVVAERYVRMCGRAEPFKNLDDAVKRIRGQAEEPVKKEIETLLSRARSVERGLGTLLEKQEYEEAIKRARGVDRLITRAYARIQKPLAKEFRGVWDHTGTGLYPGDWERTCKILADSGISAVLPNIIRNGLAHYKSRVLSRSPIYSEYGDQLRLCAAAAKKNGLQVHAWKICWRMESAPRKVLARLKDEGRLQADLHGSVVNWLCPSDERNQEFELSAIKELAGYAVQGIHLDYNRYRDGRTCYCGGCRERFEKKLGRGIKDWPVEVRRMPLRMQYQAWKCRQTESLVRKAAGLLSEQGKGIILSAAVFAGYPQCVAGVGQDWAKWVKDSNVHFVCPMNYTVSSAEFSAFLRDQVILPNAAGRIIPGIGVTADQSHLTPNQTIEQILVSRAYGAAGYVLFQLDGVLERETLPAMRLGVSAPWAR